MHIYCKTIIPHGLRQRQPSAAKAEEVKFDVNFKIDINGILTVTAQLKENKENKQQLVVETYKGRLPKIDSNLIDVIQIILSGYISNLK